MSSFKHLEIFSDKELLSSAVNIYMYLDRYGARRGTCSHSMNTIAKALKMSRRTVERRIKDLEDNGYILVINRYRNSGAKTSNAYQILK